MQVDLVTREDLLRMQRTIIMEIKSLKDASANEPTQWIKSPEVMEMLRISKGKLQQMRLNGSLPYSKVGGVIYYAKADIEKLLQSKKVLSKQR